MSPRPSAQTQREQLRARIVEGFERRAAQEGPRAVVMSELARDLGISTRTLYQVFESKAELVQAIMEDWAAEVEADQNRRYKEHATVRDRLREGAVVWMQGVSRFSQAFWSQVGRDFPEAAALLGRQVNRNFARSGNMLVAALRKDVLPGHAIPLLLNAIQEAAKPSLCDRLGISRRESVERAVDLWCRGALTPEGQEERRPGPSPIRPVR